MPVIGINDEAKPVPTDGPWRWASNTDDDDDVMIFTGDIDLTDEKRKRPATGTNAEGTPIPTGGNWRWSSNQDGSDYVLVNTKDINPTRDEKKRSITETNNGATSIPTDEGVWRWASNTGSDDDVMIYTKDIKQTSSEKRGLRKWWASRTKKTTTTTRRTTTTEPTTEHVTRRRMEPVPAGEINFAILRGRTLDVPRATICGEKASANPSDEPFPTYIPHRGALPWDDISRQLDHPPMHLLTRKPVCPPEGRKRATDPGGLTNPFNAVGLCRKTFDNGSNQMEPAIDIVPATQGATYNPYLNHN